ncbi:MAG: hypothetical protein GX434_13435 [Peptococcaceae bacterium]|nr:hypothetical protein [Peptococcaceae bacterium]
MNLVPEITPDERVKAVIDILTQSLGISPKTISNLAKVNERDVEDFMKDSNSVPVEIKYNLASVSLALHNLYNSVVSVENGRLSKKSKKKSSGLKPVINRLKAKTVK